MNSDNLLVNGTVRSAARYLIRYEHGGMTFSTYNGLILGFYRLILIHFNMTVYVVFGLVMSAVCFIIVLLWTSSLSINIYKKEVYH